MTTDAQLAKQLPHNHGVKPFYRLRWRFVYHNGKPDRIGIWNGSSERMEDKACFVPKEGLLWAVVEGEKIGAWTVKEFFRIPGHEYFHAKWNAAARAPIFLREGQSYRASPDIVGLTMLTSKHAVTALVNGKVLKRPLKTEERTVKLTEHSLGG